jgi:YHS domain-containing protein
MARIFLFAILAWIAYFLVKKIGKALFASPGPRNDTPGVPETELIQDPECGAYFMKQKGVKGVVKGQVIHFCSEQCYDKYLEKRRIQK